MDSRPDRRTHFEIQLERFNLKGHRINAIDKEVAKQSSFMLDLRSLNNLKSRSKTSHLDIDGWGAVGCSLSHLKCWKYVLEQGWESCWILEDDAIINRVEKVQVDEKNPFVYLGLRGTIQTRPSSPYPLLDYDRTQFGAHSYCVHHSILPLMIQHHCLFLSVDFYMSELLAYYEIPVGFLPLCTTLDSNSDVDHFPITNTSVHSIQRLFYLGIICLLCFLAILLLRY